MKRSIYRMGAAFAVGACALLGSVAPASADDEGELPELWAITQGGQFYDNWAKALFQSPPDATHPLYPAEGKKKGADTWRCKECHGWDYRGRDGAYASGSHYTGIKGLREMSGAPPSEIAAVIRGEAHGYTPAMIPERALSSLALFVSRGQLDMTRHIDYATKVARGNAERGARFYQTICAVCHGHNGKQINFKAPDGVEYIGTVASANPQETLHKIQNGQPGVPMVSLGALSTQDLVDILAYTQTLPQE